MGRQTRYRAIWNNRHGGDVDAKPQNTGKRSGRTRGRFDENARALGSRKQEIVRPLELNWKVRTQGDDGVGERYAGKQRNSGQLGRWTPVSDEEARVEISFQALPRAAHSSAPFGLPAGHDPVWSGLTAKSQPHGLGICRA